MNKGIQARVIRSQLHPLFRDVFLYGRSDREPLSLATALTLRLRGDGLLSHESAAHLWQLSDLRPPTVTALLVGRSTSAPPGVTLHRVDALHPDDIRWRSGIPVTSPARTLLDFAVRASLPRTESALAMLRRQQPGCDAQIRSTLARLPRNHPGARLIRRLLELPPTTLILTRSVYERRLRDLLSRAGLPAPESNQMIAGHERDLVWRKQKLIVEFDGWEFHKDRFRQDRARDAAAVATGWRVIRITADRVDTDALRVIAEIAAALSAH